MLQVRDATVDIVADLYAAEGWVHFKWPDPMYGVEELRIDLDGHCSRNMPIRSGSGVFDFVELRRDAIRIRFEPTLARLLELAEDVEISFSNSDDSFAELQAVVDWFKGLEQADLT